MAFTVEPSNALVGAPIAPAMKVALHTAGGSVFPLAGIPVTLALANNPATATLSGTFTVNTDANGVATFYDISLDKAGVGYTLTATSPGLTPDTSSPFTVTAPFLGGAANFSILAGTAVVNTGVTTVSGDVGVSPGVSITGFPEGSVGGDFHVNDAAAVAGQAALMSTLHHSEGQDTHWGDCRRPGRSHPCPGRVSQHRGACTHRDTHPERQR